MSRSDEARSLARGFAAALEHLHTTWDVVYLPAGKLPIPAAPSSESKSTPAHATRPSAPETAQGRPALRQRAESWSARTKLEYLRRKNIGDCRRCGLCRSRTNIVFGVGNPEADIMVVGEAPGADEDRRGEPFVGAAGKRLDAWLSDLGLSRDAVYIANVLKCRPPANRDPKPEEVDRCSPFLEAQVRAVAPKVIVALGRHAGMLLSRREDMTLGAMRKTRLSYDASGKHEPPGSRTIALVVTYHPAYVLRQDGDADRSKRATEAVMNDLRRAVEIATAHR